MITLHYHPGNANLAPHIVLEELGVPAGDVIWQVGSLHVYERHFYLIHHFSRTNEVNITKQKYRELYPDTKKITHALAGEQRIGGS
jgi:thymidylate synthase